SNPAIRICLVLEIMPEHQAFERRLCRALAFGVRQLAGAFDRAVEFEAAWFALVDKSGDKSPQSKRCRAGKTACWMTVPRVRSAKHRRNRGLLSVVLSGLR